MMVKLRKVIGYTGLVVGLISLVLGVVLLQGNLFDGGLIFTTIGYTLLTVDRMEATMTAILEEAKAARQAAGKALYLLERPKTPSQKGPEEKTEQQ